VGFRANIKKKIKKNRKITQKGEGGAKRERKPGELKASSFPEFVISSVSNI